MQSRRRIAIAVPPAWFFFNVLLLTVLAVLVWADREHWHHFVTDPSQTHALEVRLSALEVKTPVTFAPATSDQQARADIRTLDAQVDRAASLAVTAFAAVIMRNGNLTSAQAEALLTRCLKWAQEGGDFATQCN